MKCLDFPKFFTFFDATSHFRKLCKNTIRMLDAINNIKFVMHGQYNK